MAFLDLVKQRYSCRSYQKKSVEQEKLDYVMECVRFAPSAVNKQPWMFRIVKNDADKAKLQECYNREWFETASMYIICSICAWQLPSKVSLPAGSAISMPRNASNSLTLATMRNRPC